VHLKITVPTESISRFKQVVGPLHGARLRGSLDFETIAGGLTLEQTYANVSARSGGGDVTIRTFKGDRIELESGTGDMTLDDVQAKEAIFRSTTGAIRGQGIVAGSAVVRSGSGDVKLADVDPASVKIETDSGEVDFATRLKSTRQATIQ